jgi:hypothetical protein
MLDIIRDATILGEVMEGLLVEEWERWYWCTGFDVESDEVWRVTYGFTHEEGGSDVGR